LALEAVTMMMEYAIQHLNLIRFVAKISEKNKPSIELFVNKLKFSQIEYSQEFGEFTYEYVVKPSQPSSQPSESESDQKEQKQNEEDDLGSFLASYSLPNQTLSREQIQNLRREYLSKFESEMSIRKSNLLNSLQKWKCEVKELTDPQSARCGSSSSLAKAQRMVQAFEKKLVQHEKEKQTRERKVLSTLNSDPRLTIP